MSTQKIIRRNDGTVRAECRYDACEPLTGFGIEVGAECCMGIGTDELGNEDVIVTSHEGGMEGNSGTARRLHGWRGTTNGYSRHAHGWRRVLEIGTLKRGLGEYIVFSADLKPDAE